MTAPAAGRRGVLGSSTAQVSQWRDVYASAGARGVSLCGDLLATTALVLTLQSAGAGGTAISALMLAGALPLVLLAPLTGRLVDRLDSRTLLITVGLAQAAVCAVLAYTSDPVIVVGLVAALAAGLAVTQPTLAALVPQMVSRRDLPRATAIGQTATSVGALAGPALAGMLVGAFGARLPLLLDAASYLAFAAAGLVLRTRRGGRSLAGAAQPAPGAPAGAAVKEWRVWRDPLIRAMLGSLALVIAAVGAINVIEVFFIRETLHASATLYGLTAASWLFGMLIGAWLFARRARRAAEDGALVRGVLWQLAGCCAVVFVTAATSSAGWILPLFFAGGLLNGGTNVYTSVVLGRRVPLAGRGRAYATQGAAAQGGSLVGYIAGGVLLHYYPPRPLVAAVGLAGLLVVAGFVLPVVRATRRERIARAATASDSWDTVRVAA